MWIISGVRTERRVEEVVKVRLEVMDGFDETELAGMGLREQDMME